MYKISQKVNFVHYDKQNYLFFDEIQNVEKWEKAINSFKAKYNENVSVFITGSNSDLLSGELATHLAGRYVSFKIYPFTFKEVCELKHINDKNQYELENDFNEYVKWGGLPQRFIMSDENQIKTYLSDIYNSIIVKDIITRFNIKDIDLFNRIVEYIVTTSSQTFSAESLANYFLNNDGREVSKITLYNYLEYMSKAMLISKADRYDVKVGNLENREIDFIATRYEEKIYIQVAFILADDSVIDREFGAFDYVQDHYPKYVISTDKFDMSQNGIIHKNIIEWLLEEK